MNTLLSFRYRLLLLLILPLNLGCSKGKTVPPAFNLTLEVQASNDGSGLVNFTAFAEGADRYYFNFGISTNEEAVRSTDGKASKRYPASGTYTVKVTAYNAKDASAVLSRDVQVVVKESDEGYRTPQSYPGMNLVWSDEFNATQLSNDWVFDIGNGTDGWGNNELQYYRRENVSLDGQYLAITAKKESYNGSSYTSSRIKTEGRKSFKYGRIDIRAKTPKGQGIWPALWMLGANYQTVSWPYSGEIDIMELVGGGPGKDNTVHGTIHFDNEGDYASFSKAYSLASGNFADQFHVFSLLWDENAITWLVDDKEFHKQDITHPSMSEFHEEFFLIFNVAVGGRWPGSPDASTAFPQRMLVDYVRVFQK